jgi:hypothetical protein
MPKKVGLEMLGFLILVCSNSPHLVFTALVAFSSCECDIFLSIIDLTAELRWGLFAPWNYLPSMALRHDFSENLAIYTIVTLKYVPCSFYLPDPSLP